MDTPTLPVWSSIEEAVAMLNDWEQHVHLLCQMFPEWSEAKPHVERFYRERGFDSDDGCLLAYNVAHWLQGVPFSELGVNGADWRMYIDQQTIGTNVFYTYTLERNP